MCVSILELHLKLPSQLSDQLRMCFTRFRFLLSFGPPMLHLLLVYLGEESLLLTLERLPQGTSGGAFGLILLLPFPFLRSVKQIFFNSMLTLPYYINKQYRILLLSGLAPTLLPNFFLFIVHFLVFFGKLLKSGIHKLGEICNPASATDYCCQTKPYAPLIEFYFY